LRQASIQRKELEEERGDQHLAQETAVFVDRAEKPCDVEPARQIGEGSPLRHQHEPAIPYDFELGPRHQGWSRGIRRLDDDLVLASLAEQQKAPVAQGGNSGQWRIGEPIPFGRQGAGFEAEPPRAPDHFRDADRPRSEMMTNLLGIDPDTLKTQRHDPSGKTRIRY
jgi:hypothetical protein